jgi:replication-associated recombination protein RarA
MYAITGQKKLVALFSTYTLSNMPQAMLLLGPRGSGKTLLVERLAKNLRVPLVKLTKDTSPEELIGYNQNFETAIYLLDLVNVSEKAQNKFLKFIEEPSSRVKIILEAESEVGVLPTILNRCQKLALEPYSMEELQSFSWAPRANDSNRLIYEFCSTPGQLLELAETDCFANLYNLCSHIIRVFPTLKDHEHARALSICTKIANKKTSVRKFDLALFLDMLAYVAFEDYKTTFADFSLAVYLAVVEQKKAILNKVVAKDAVMLTFLNKLWELSRT